MKLAELPDHNAHTCDKTGKRTIKFLQPANIAFKKHA